MPPLAHWLVFMLLAFLLGSIPFGLLIARAKGIDIRKHGSGNIGATNVGRVLGKKYFVICFTLDFLKGFCPTLLAGVYFGISGRMDVPREAAYLWLTVMLCPVLGHVFSPWIGFKGGKGVATGLGSALGLFPVFTIAGLFAGAVFGVVARTTRYVSVASMAAGLSVPIFVLLLYVFINVGTSRRVPFESSVPFLGFGCVLAALVIWTHRANIKRLRAGIENRIGGRNPPKQG